MSKESDLHPPRPLRPLRRLLDDLIAEVAFDIEAGRVDYGERVQRTMAEILDRYAPGSER